MKVTYNWLKDFVDISMSAHMLAKELTMAGLEVTSLETKDGDTVFEIEITSNRPDWLSVIGIAREVAAITDKKLKLKSPVERILPAKDKAMSLKLDIEDRKDCPLYTAKIIRDVKIGPSPDWLRRRLESVGVRSINNVVDITNYILFTWGEPLHAFDLDKVMSITNGGPFTIDVRRASKNEEIVSIDGIKRLLDKDILVIAASGPNGLSSPVAIAGIMGGAESEVDDNTRNIILEAAVFDPVVIRRARQKLGMQTDSSYRFERGIDVDTVRKASFSAADLIKELALGRHALSRSLGQDKQSQRAIKLDADNVSRVLGIDISVARAKNTLVKLGFESCFVKKKKKTENRYLSVKVPSYRQDVTKEVDLIEEVARITGYENIPVSLPVFTPQISGFDIRSLTAQIKNILMGLGINEVITYSLIDKETLAKSGISCPDISNIVNPLSKEQEVLRPTLIPSLLKCAAYNLNQKQEKINIFEIANIYSPSGSSLREESALGIALCGVNTFLFEQGTVRDNIDILHAKGVLEKLCERLGIRGYSFLQEKAGEGEIMLCAGQDRLGVIRRVPSAQLAAHDIKNRNVVTVQLSLNSLLAKADMNRKFEKLPVYPAVMRDLSLLIKENIKIEDVLSVIRDNAGDLLSEVKISDYYKGKQIPDGFIGLTISCLYRSSTRTLTDEEVNYSHSRVCDLVKERFEVTLR